MATGTQFCLLQPLVVHCGEAVVAMRPGKQRAVLAALLLNVGRVVSLDEIAESLWGAAPPSARVTARNYVRRPQQTSGDSGRSRISTQPGGYLISLSPRELTVTRFGERLESARFAAGRGSWDTTAGHAHARATLALWRGQPLVDVESEVLAAREVLRLAEMRQQALETRSDAGLYLGQHADVIGELRQLAAASPLRERFRAHLMLALYRCDRQAEGLAACQYARGVQVEEFGADPGTELRELRQRILTTDPALALADARQTAAGGLRPVVPRQMPAPAAQFNGRTGELRQVNRQPDQAGGAVAAGTAVIAAISGTVSRSSHAPHISRQIQTDDDLLAVLLVNTWALITGRALRSDVPPGQLSAAELIDFWADDLTARGGTGAVQLVPPRRWSWVTGVAERPPMGGQVRGMFAVDIAAFTAPGRDDEIQQYIRKALYDMLASAFDGSGLPWNRSDREDRGDGALVILPPEASALPLIDPLPERLRALIRRHNRLVREPAGIQLRAAVHVGPVHHDDNGFVSSDLNFLSRMLDARPAKRVLAESGAELVLTVSRYVYDTLVRRHPSLVDPALFQPFRTRVKQTPVHAWMYVPGLPSAQG